jgi:hypothetical protein
MRLDPPCRPSDLFAWLTYAVEPFGIVADMLVVRLPVAEVAEDEVMVLYALAKSDHVPWVELQIRATAARRHVKRNDVMDVQLTQGRTRTNLTLWVLSHEFSSRLFPPGATSRLHGVFPDASRQQVDRALWCHRHPSC